MEPDGGTKHLPFVEITLKAKAVNETAQIHIYSRPALISFIYITVLNLPVGDMKKCCFQGQRCLEAYTVDKK